MEIITQRVPGLKQGVDWRRTISWPDHPEITLANNDKIEAKVVEYPSGNSFSFAGAKVHSVFKNQGDVEKIGGFIVTPTSYEIIFSGEQTRLWTLGALGGSVTRTLTPVTVGTPPDQVTIQQASLVFPKSILNMTVFITDVNGIDRLISGAEWEFEMEASTGGIQTVGGAS